MAATPCPACGAPTVPGAQWCSVCGIPLAAPPSPPTKAPERRGLILVVAVIVVVVLLALGFTVLYLSTGIIESDGPPPGPTVALAQVGNCTAGTCQGHVTAVSERYALDQYRVTVLLNSTTIIPAASLAMGTVNGGGVTFNYQDLGQAGVTVGDTFDLSGLQAESTYRVALLWAATGREVVSLSFTP